MRERRTQRPTTRAAMAPACGGVIRRAALSLPSFLLAWLCAAAPVPAATGGTGAGVRLDLQDMLERRARSERGELLRVSPSLSVRRATPPHQDTIREEIHYSPDLQTVFTLEGPGFLPEEPEYYLYEGAYYVYDPRPFRDPSLEIHALPREVHQERMLRQARAELFAQARRRGLQARGRGDDAPGIEMTIARSLPGPLSAIVGNRETTIKVTGRESISFAGESRRVSPFIRQEQGRGQSLFPRLDMQQDLQVKLEGTIGGKVHLAVDHNSNAFGFDANRINIWYEGFEDDIIQRIDLGGTNLSLPGSGLVSFSGGSQGLFGVKTQMRLGGLDLTVVASKEETEAATRTLTPSGGSSAATPLAENAYARDRFFFYERPDTSDIALYNSYGLHPDDLIDQIGTSKFFVFIDDQEPSTLQDRNYRGYAVANLQAGSDTTSMNQTFDTAADEERWPPVPGGGGLGSEDYTPGRWRRLDENEVGFVFFEDLDRLVLGFHLRNGPLDQDDVLAISFDDADGQTVGSIEEGATPTVRLRLIRHPDQDQEFEKYPTSVHMMRHVYVLPATSLSRLELSIESLASGDQNRDVPDNLPNSTYLHMFGLDELDEANRPVPDGLFDESRTNLWDPQQGFLFLPGLRPFGPPPEIVSLRLRRAGVDSADAYDPATRDSLFGEVETVRRTMYTLAADDPTIPKNRYQILVRISGAETQITLPQDIIEGSDQVRLDGRLLQRGVDYDIEPYAGGKITLKGDVLNEMSPSSRIEVSYQYRPLIGSGQATLLGASGTYKLGNRGRIASVWLFESRRGFSRRPRLGEEPTRTLLGDMNANLRFQPGWMTRLVDALPFTNTRAASGINFTAEVAVSVPNPNTKNTAFVDDLESAEDSDQVSVSRNNWFWASIPDGVPASNPDASADPDTIYRVPLAWYNPFGEVKRGHLNPLLDETEADDGITVLELGFNRDQAKALVDSIEVDNTRLWSGIMTSFAGNGLDLTQTKTIEFWFNDEIAAAEQRRGRMHIDFGDISEDFIFFRNNPNRDLDTQERFNREAESESEFLAQSDDLGWNGVADDCDGFQEGEGPPFPPPGSDCHLPSKFNPTLRQHAWANGTEENNEYDTEDINGNGRWDTTNRYFRFTMELDDPTWVDIDVPSRYGDDPTIDPDLKLGFDGWRKYRIDFDRIRDQLEVITDAGQSPPSLRQIRYLRIWFDDPEAPSTGTQVWDHDIQIHDFKLTGNQWLHLGVFAIDSTQVAPAPGESFSVSVINNKDDPEYTIPPDAEELDAEGVQAREQSLRLDFTSLQPGHEVVVQKTIPSGRGQDYTQYKRLNFFVHYPVSTMSDTVEVFFRVGTDSLNYYEIARTLPGKGDWLETIIDLADITNLKFPEDVPGAEVKTLRRGAQSIIQVTATVPDVGDPTVPLQVTRRGEPSLKSVTRLFVGVRHPHPAPVVQPPAGGVGGSKRQRLARRPWRGRSPESSGSTTCASRTSTATWAWRISTR
ncbi:MAG: hypothetical protein ACE5G2_06355 [Candidatus Krumholzibacteriia bacterium]